MDNLVLSNVLHRPARTFVSISGIAVGILLIVFTVGLANGSMRGQAAREANVGAEIFFRAPGSVGMSGSDVFRLPAALRFELEKVEGVEKAVMIGQKMVETEQSNVGRRLIDGIVFDEYAPVAGLTIIEGRPFSINADEVIIDTAWQKQKKVDVGDDLEVFERNFKIVGTYEPAAGARIKIPLAVMQKQLESPDLVTAFLVKIKKGYTPEQVAQRLKNAFPDNQILLTKDLEELYMSSIPALNVFLNVIIAVAALISALVILLTMYTTVTERTRQIGILKSMGMPKARIAWIITQEALFLSVGGIVCGIILAVALRYALTFFITLEVEISLLVLFLTLLIGTFGGIIGALYPALKAARLDAVEALNYE